MVAAPIGFGSNRSSSVLIPVLCGAVLCVSCGSDDAAPSDTANLSPSRFVDAARFVRSGSFVGTDGVVDVVFAFDANPAGADGLYFTGDDKVAHYKTTQLEVADGGQTERGAEFEYFNPGPDGTWFTSDDGSEATVNVQAFPSNQAPISTAPVFRYSSLVQHRSAWYEDRRDANGLLLSSTGFVAVGADGVKFTADDVVDRYMMRSDDNQRIWFYASSGPDGAWRTDDDGKSELYGKVTIGAAALASYRIDWYSFGSDGLIDSSDDVLCGSETVDNLADGGRQFDLSDTDKCGYVNTDGDSAMRVQEVFDSSGNVVKTVHRDPRVTSAAFGEITSYVSYAYAGALVETKFFGKPGADGEWFTNDDEMISYIVDRSESGNPDTTLRVEYDYFAVSPAAVDWFERVENIAQYQRFYTEPVGNGVELEVIDTYGARRDEFGLPGKGPDGVWFTSDDVITESSVHVVRR